jgi:PTH1 family peptidyl-tRNA hydrolase
MNRLVVGLGNPGEEYYDTRHNVGYIVVDMLSKVFKRRFQPGKGSYYYFSKRYRNYNVIIAKPTTYMNISGKAVAELVDKYNIDFNKMIIICDDINLTFGQIRIREKGSDGGHKGIESIIYSLENERFPRLRIGIGSPDKDTKDYVLEKFSSTEMNEIREISNRANDAIFEWINNDIISAMNKFNIKLVNE